jgi:enoyl-CoA hydratase
MSESIRYELRDKVVLITMDDGKANALSPAAIEAITAALARAEADNAAVVLAGREKRLSGGLTSVS